MHFQALFVIVPLCISSGLAGRGTGINSLGQPDQEFPIFFWRLPLLYTMPCDGLFVNKSLIWCFSTSILAGLLPWRHRPVGCSAYRACLPQHLHHQEPTQDAKQLTWSDVAWLALYCRNSNVSMNLMSVRIPHDFEWSWWNKLIFYFRILFVWRKDFIDIFVEFGR